MTACCIVFLTSSSYLIVSTHCACMQWQTCYCIFLGQQQMLLSMLQFYWCPSLSGAGRCLLVCHSLIDTGFSLSALWVAVFFRLTGWISSSESTWVKSAVWHRGLMRLSGCRRFAKRPRFNKTGASQETWQMKRSDSWDYLCHVIRAFWGYALWEVTHTSNGIINTVWLPASVLGLKCVSPLDYQT